MYTDLVTTQMNGTGTPRRACMSAAALVLSAVGDAPTPGRPATVTVESDGACLRFTGELPAGRGRPGYEGVRPEDAPEHWMFFSPRDAQIVNAVSVGANANGQWMTAEAICQAIGETNSAELRGILKNLVDRLILESAPSRGYRLHPTPPKEASPSPRTEDR